MSQIQEDGVRYDIITFSEALTRLGMLDKVYGASDFYNDLVAYAPNVNADYTGELQHYCSGNVLYTFVVVERVRHLPDEPWAWKTTNQVRYVVIDVENVPFLKCVVPAV